MLLYVTGPVRADEERARRVFSEIAAAWPPIAAARTHPRTGTPLIPAVTRLDLLLAAFSPSPTPDASGLSILIPPPEDWWRWVPALRRALRELIRSTFPPGPRYAAPFDPVGPITAAPSAADTAHLRTVAGDLRNSPDPAQRPVDPRLWLVLAPALPGELETIFLSTILRAEPFARVARAPEGTPPLPPWLEGEVDALLAGKNLATAGLVADMECASEGCHMTASDEGGTLTARSDLFDLVSGLEDLYATKEMLEPGEVYNRFHSHTGSEELYIVLEGEGVIRVNERVLPIKAGQCFGKPRGYDCSTQILNTGTAPMVFLDVGTMNIGEVDLGRYPDHGELLARLGGHRWFVPTEAILPGSELGEVYDRRYFRSVSSPEARIVSKPGDPDHSS
jgi:uncharacterized cupin superfamily protein